MRIVKFPVLSILLAGILSCSPDNPKLIADPPGQRKTTSGATEDSDAMVDILFIIDDSGSMGVHQSNLAGNIAEFINELTVNKKLDYHLGVITTTDQDYWSGHPEPGGRLQGTPRYVEKSDPNAVAHIATNLRVGVDGSGDEKMFVPMINALSAPYKDAENAGFLREDAHLAIVILTDGEDNSGSTGAKQAYDFLVGLKKGAASKIITYGAIIPYNDFSCTRDPDFPWPQRITEFFNLSGGITFRLCDPQFGKQLATIGKDLARKVGSKILLESRPVLSSIAVNYGTQIIPPGDEEGWIYNIDDNSITFGPKLVWTDQPDGTTITVNYTEEK